jgi:hypothetical protein
MYLYLFQECKELMKDAKLFPIEVDLSRSAFLLEFRNQLFKEKERKKEWIALFTVLSFIFLVLKN